jgi:PAS domain S-box-containing protein
VGLKSYNEYNRALNYSEVVHFEDYFPENDSWLEVSAYPSKSGLSVYFKDITERKRQEKIIRESNERFEKISEATNDAIWDFDVINNSLFWGKGYENQFGYNLDEFKPSLEVVLSLIHPEDRNHIAGKIQKFMSDGVSTNWFEEYRFKNAHGTYAYVIDRAIFVRDEEGQVTRVLGAMTDISYRKEYEESLKKLNDKLKRHTKELEVSNQELEQFAYVTSHDLQEPLRMISSFLTLLEKKYGDKLDEKALEYIYYAVDGAKRMKKIILDLLEFSKVGRFNEVKETVDLKELVEEYCILRKKLIQEKDVSIQFEDLSEINTYRVPLTQIFHNLLDNAIKYSKEDTPPEIKITAKEHHDHWEFALQDNGIGIPQDYFDKIFIIFQRLHNKDVYEGTGMGLAIVKKIIETMGGKIWLSSQPGEGTTFYFTIPKTI